MFWLTAKLDNKRRNVSSWNKNYFGDIFKIKKEVEGKLENLQKAKRDGLGSKDMILEEDNCRRLWKDTMNREEMY